MNAITRISVLFMLTIAGCVGPSHHDSDTAKQCAMSQCAVCKMNADLACVDVPVDDQTPRTEYLGKTYYFCSDECRQKFIANPEKYAKAVNGEPVTGR